MKYLVFESTRGYANGATCEDPQVGKFLLLQRDSTRTGFVPNAIAEQEPGVLRVSGNHMTLLLRTLEDSDAED